MQTYRSTAGEPLNLFKTRRVIMTVHGYGAMDDFVTFHQLKKTDSGLCRFSAHVTFDGKQKASEDTDVEFNFNNRPSREIGVTETGSLHSAHVHLDFLSHFQKFHCEQGVITINGTSDKCGNYTVTISYVG